MLADAIEFIKLIKRVAIQAVKAEKLVEVSFGKVQSIDPLEILVEQKLHLGESQLILTRNVTKYPIKIAKEESNAKPVKITVHNELVVGERVLLVRQQGGQKYIVVDRIG